MIYHNRKSFKTDKQLYNLVILNNAADCCVKGKLSYADLMPDCTVEDFLNALYVRFGLVYNVSSDTKTATLRLIRDIVDDVPDIDLSRSLTDEPLITYETARQMKLSAKTSFTGAAPSVERFEDYLKDQEVARLARVDVSQRVIHLNYEETTGRWFKWDEDNKRLTYSSSSFFSWDRKSDSIEDNELTSDDECVPMDFAPNDILSLNIWPITYTVTHILKHPPIMMMKIRRKWKHRYLSCLRLHPHRIVNILSVLCCLILPRVRRSSSKTEVNIRYRFYFNIRTACL